MTRDDVMIKHMDKVSMEPMSGCWLWTASVDKHGYGMLWNGTRMDRAHRMFFSASTGIDIAGMSVLHYCDNPSCVNPNHLHVGTQAQNMNERSQRGRAGKIINQSVADDIRAMISLGSSQRATAEAFGVSQKLVWSINKGDIWIGNR